MVLKGIIFDVDGMLNISGQFSDKYSKEHKIPIERMNVFFKGPFQKCLVGKADLKEELMPYLKNWGWKGSVDELVRFWFKGDENLDSRFLPIIKGLRNSGVLCYVATQNEKYRTDYLIKEMSFGQIFDKVFSSSEIGLKKGERGFFDRIFKDLIKHHPSSNEGDMVFWDDDVKNVISAKEYGFSAHQYSSFEEFQKIMKQYGLK